MSDCNQYYTIATTAIFFYDFFLTLADEVSRVIAVPARQVYRPPRERSNTLGTGGNHGVRGGNHLSHGIR